MSETTTEAVSGPATLGLNDSEDVQLAPGTSVLPQFVAKPKSAESAPVSARLVMTSDAVPGLDNVTD